MKEEATPEETLIAPPLLETIKVAGVPLGMTPWPKGLESKMAFWKMRQDEFVLR